MKRRQFLKAIPAVAVASVVGVKALADGGVFRPGDVMISGTQTGRFSSKQRMFAELYGWRGGKSRAADLAAYRSALDGKRVFMVKPNKNAVIQMGNADFHELEARVLSYFS